jgi:hypothetical protein
MDISELGNLFFQLAGFFAEPLDFLDENRNRVMFNRIDHIGGCVLIPVTAEELANSPEEGTPLRCAGGIRIGKSNQKVSLRPMQYSIQGRDPNFKPLTEAELLAGALFHGTVLILGKKDGVFNDQIYRNGNVALMGGAYQFSGLSEQLFSQFPMSGIAEVSGKVDTKITSVLVDGRSSKTWENSLLLHKVLQHIEQTRNEPRAEQRATGKSAAA